MRKKRHRRRALGRPFCSTHGPDKLRVKKVIFNILGEFDSHGECHLTPFASSIQASKVQRRKLDTVQKRIDDYIEQIKCDFLRACVVG